MRKLLVLSTVLLLSACGKPVDKVEPVANNQVVLELPALSGEHVWQVDHDASTIRFEAIDGGKPFSGKFDRFAIQIKMNPEDPVGGAIMALIDIASVDASSNERTGALPSKEWFDTARFPIAEFSSENITRLADGSYAATGNLSIKGLSKEIVLPFTLSQDGETALANASVTLSRTDFNVGEGNFKTDEQVGYPVRVDIKVKASR